MLLFELFKFGHWRHFWWPADPTGDLFSRRSKYIAIPDSDRRWVLWYNPCSAQEVWPLLLKMEDIKVKIKAWSLKRHDQGDTGSF